MFSFSYSTRCHREVFAPTPVVFVLNKADIASADQIHCVREAVERERFANSCGVVHTVSARKNWAQNWCSRCFSDDVTFRKAGNQLRCEQCGHIEALTEVRELVMKVLYCES